MSLFLCMMWGCVLVSLIYIQLSSFPSTVCQRDFSHFMFLPLFQRLIDSRCPGLFLGSPLCSIGPDVCFCTSTMLSWLLLLCNIVLSQGELCLCLPVHTPPHNRIALVILGLLWFCKNFWIICPSSVKKMSWVIW